MRRSIGNFSAWMALVVVTATGSMWGCAQKEAGAPIPSPTEAASSPASPKPQSTAPGAPADKSMAGGDEAAAAPARERMIIRNAELTLKVEQVRPAAEAVQQKAKEMGGFVVQASVVGEGNSLRGHVTVRVPAARFDEAVKHFEGLAQKVLAQSVTGEDVTDQYVDLESQLRNYEASRNRILELLQKATHAGEALEVNRALTEVQGQIEQISGRMKYLRQSADLSAIAVTLTQESAVPMVEEDGFQPVRIAKVALRTLVSLLTYLVYLILFIAILSPIWLPFWWLLRVWRRRRAARRAAKAAQAAGPKV